jgi:hypothetical protein
LTYLEPKIKRILVENFPEFSFYSFSVADNIAKLAAHYGVFNALTLILFLNGRGILLELGKTLAYTYYPRY